jgi:hypothetical protein
MEFSRFLFIFVIVLCILSIRSAVAESDEYEYEDEEVTSATAAPGASKQSMNSKENIRNLGTDEYEYEYEDEEVPAIPSDTPHFPNPVNQRHDHNQQEQLDFDLPMTNGFIRHGGGLMKIGRPLVDEIYINETVEKYDCVRFVDSLVQIIDAQDDEEEAMNVTAQIHELKQKMDKVLQMANRAINAADGRSEDSAATADATTRKVQPKNESQPTDHTEVNTKPQKRMSFREKQALRLQQRKEREIAREALRPKYRLGADCESLICASCKSIMDEFGQLIFNAIRDPKVRYVDQLTENFCGSKVIAVKYVDVVRDVCSAFEQENLGYKEAMVSAFEGLQRWDDANKLPKLAALKKNVCTAIGACENEQFDFQKEALHYTQEHWDDQCFTCQAFAKDLEERVHLTRHLTERSIVPLVAETCDRLDLEPHYRKVCQPMTQGKLLDDIAWLAKMHGESVVRKAKAELKFPDKLCQEIDWCKPWVDPEKLKEKEAEASMEQVFF